MKNCKKCKLKLFHCDIVDEKVKTYDNNENGYYGNAYMPVVGMISRTYRCPKCFTIQKEKC